MPKSGKGRHKGAKAKKGRAVPYWENSTMVRYTGPPMPLGALNANQVIVTRLSLAQQVSTGLTGVLFAGTSNDPSGFQDWSSYAGLYQQFRVLAWKLTWVPREIGFSSQGTIPNQGQLVVWRARTLPIAIPTSYNAAWDNAGAQVHHVSRQFSVTMRMDGTPDADWKQTSSGGSTAGIAIYGDAFAVSTVYGQIFYEILVQLRSRA